MANLARTKEQVAENVRRLHQYSNGTARERRFHSQTIKNGKVFVYLREGDHSLFAPSKFAGYANNDLNISREKGRGGRDANPHLDVLIGRHLDKGSTGYDEIDALYLKYCREFGMAPSEHPRPRRYWSLDLSSPVVRSAVSVVTRHRDLWTDAELSAAVDAYFQMLDLHLANEPHSKAAFKKALVEGPLRGRKSIDHRMQNISSALREMGQAWLPGFNPLPHIGSGIKARLLKLIQDRVSVFDRLEPVKRPIVREGRKLPATGYWMFVCRRGRWDGTIWLQSDSDETLYMVSEVHRDEVQVGDLSVLRLNKLVETKRRKSQPAGVYAVLEVIEAPELRVSDDYEGFSDPADAVALKWRAKVRLLVNLVENPIDHCPKAPSIAICVLHFLSQLYRSVRSCSKNLQGVAATC